MALFGWIFESRIVDYGLTMLTVGVVGVLGVMYVFQNRLIYLSDFPPGSRNTVWRPSKFGLNEYEEVTIRSADGVRIHGFWITCAGAKETVLWLHANAGNMGHRLPMVRRLTDVIPLNVLIISYRGYGESEGVAEERGIKMDSQAALDYLFDERGQVKRGREGRSGGLEKRSLDLEKRSPDLKRSPALEKRSKNAPGSVILYGQSIGGAVAFDLAAKNMERVKAVIVENTFLSLPKLIPHVMPMLSWVAPLCHERWESEERIREMIKSGKTVPRVLLLAGSKDEMVPHGHMLEIHGLLKAQGASLKTFAKGTHNDTCIQPGYFEAIAEFLNNM